MKAKWMIPAIALMLPLGAAAEAVYEAHDRFPGVVPGAREHGDCDHKECKSVAPASVPEPGPLPLLALGLGMLYVVTRRGKE